MNTFGTLVWICQTPVRADRIWENPTGFQEFTKTKQEGDMIVASYLPL